MQFLILGYDGTDAEAAARRQAARSAHIQVGDEMSKKGEMLCAAALLDEKEHMTGSAIICNFPSRKELDAWLKIEPYVTGKVWQKIEVKNCKLGPSFAHLLHK
jgi:uncharacterized protein YciI